MGHSLLVLTAIELLSLPCIFLRILDPAGVHQLFFCILGSLLTYLAYTSDTVGRILALVVLDNLLSG